MERTFLYMPHLFPWVPTVCQEPKLDEPPHSAWKKKRKNLGWTVELMALNLNCAEILLTSVDDLEQNRQDLCCIWPVVTRHFLISVFLPLGKPPGTDGTDQFWLSEKYQIFHTSQTELSVNKIGYLRLIVLPFQGPDVRMFTVASVAHWKLWLENFVS